MWTYIMWGWAVWVIGAVLFFATLELNRRGIGPKSTDGRTAFEIVESRIGRSVMRWRAAQIAVVWPGALIVLAAVELGAQWPWKSLE